jgi:L-lysine exporter family protein LysE/ArgO
MNTADTTVASLLAAATSGLLLGGGLIMAIGAQNAYLLRMGLARQHVFVLAGTAALVDALLIAAGLLGLGALIQAAPALATALRWGGVVFLTWYAWAAARRAWTGGTLGGGSMNARVSARQAVLTLLGLSLLNPHVYLDTVVLVGAIGSHYAGPERAAFGAGAALASFIWFFSLTWGARFLAPWLATAKAWRWLDGVIALTMLGLAASLALD